MQDVEITIISATEAKILVGGMDMSAVVQAFTVNANVLGGLPSLVLYIPIVDQSRVKGQVKVEVDEASAALLQQIGWRPPKEEASDG